MLLFIRNLFDSQIEITSLKNIELAFIKYTVIKFVESQYRARPIFNSILIESQYKIMCVKQYLYMGNVYS